jgi:hypothetical protein
MVATRSEEPAMTRPLPGDDLEQQAENQRARLHQSVTELRSTVRQTLDFRKVAHDHLWPVSAALGALALAVGYGVASFFSD